MKTIRFKQLQLTNFKSHRERTINFGELTKLSGKNGQGKTTIGEAPAWILCKTDLLGGSKYDPSPTTYEFDKVHAALLLTVDGTDVLLAREIDKGKNKYYINDVPVKETEYSEHLATLFDKELFLSLYNPSFFFTQNKDKQRDQILKYVLAPTNKEVFEEMSRISPEQKSKDIQHNPQATKLAEALKKHTIPQLESLHTDLKNKNDKLYTQAQGSVKTLTGQLQALGEAVLIDRETITKELELLNTKILSFDLDRKKVIERAYEIDALQRKVDALTQQIESGTAEYKIVVAQQIEENCNACGQQLTDEAKGKAREVKAAEVRKHAERVNPLKHERITLKEKLAELKPLPELDYSVADLVARSNELKAMLQAEMARKKAAADLEAAKQNEAAHLQAKNDSIFILDAIKAFKAKEAEIQTTKVQSLFTKLSIRLFDYVKTKDEYKPDFMIQMDGKDYVSLSVGEKITAGLELTEVLFKQSGLIVPTFIDGIGEYTGKMAVYGQLITGRAIAGQELKIETEEAA